MTLKIPEHTLRTLEESLWIPEKRFDKQYMDNICADDVVEYGRSGRVYDRDSIINIEPREFKVVLPLGNFSIKAVTDAVYIITYISEATFNDSVELANRTSIWTFKNNTWKWIFHQGTPK